MSKDEMRTVILRVPGERPIRLSLRADHFDELQNRAAELDVSLDDVFEAAILAGLLDREGKLDALIDDLLKHGVIKPRRERLQ